MLYFSNLHKEKNHHFILSQFQSKNGIKRGLWKFKSTMYLS